MQVVLAAKGMIKKHTVEVRSPAEASRVVSDFISTYDLTAGCGSSGISFTGGDILDKVEGALQKVGHVSYNGRVWRTDGSEWK